MKASKIEKALATVREALRDKYGEGEEARLLITEDSVSLDGPSGEVIVNEGLDSHVAEELAT